jgi:hypothetical protein
MPYATTKYFGCASAWSALCRETKHQVTFENQSHVMNSMSSSTHFCFSAPCFSCAKAAITSDLNFSSAGFGLFPGFLCRSASMRLKGRTEFSLTNVCVEKHQFRRFKVLIQQSRTRESLLCSCVLGEFVPCAP